MPKLIRRDTGEEHELPDGATQIGRLSANDVQVFEPQVSRSHCHLEGPEGGWVVIDHGSDLGTYVNGRRVRLRGLYAGDQLRIGSVVFLFDDDPGTQITASGLKLRPISQATAEELIPPEIFMPPPPPMPRRTVIALVAIGVVALALLVALVVAATRQTPRKVVLRAARLASQRDAEGLWELLSAESRTEVSAGEFKRRVEALPHDVVRAARGLDAREGRQIEGGTAVPVALEAHGRRVADEVILRREEGQWRIHAAPVHRIPELLSPGPKHKGP